MPKIELKVHPAADVFPMLEPDELAALAADIEQNGLIHPIILDADAQVIDGRNRLAACRMAGVEPRFERLNGADPIAFILSTNIARRHMNAGQRAIAVAKVRLLSKQSVREAGDQANVSAARVTQAGIVLRFAPELAEHRPIARVVGGRSPGASRSCGKLATRLDRARHLSRGRPDQAAYCQRQRFVTTQE